MRQAYTLWALGALSSPAAAWLKVARQESWSPAQETAIAAQGLEDQAAIGFSPRPTEAPRLGRMLMPRLDGYQLGPGTCGFVESDGQAYRCIASTAICSRSGQWEGCCEPNRSCSVMKTTCIDFAASQDGQCNLPNDFHTLCCGESSAPSCFTWIISSTGTDGGDDETFTALGCQPTGGSGVLLDYDPAWSRTHSFASTASPTSGGGSSTTTSQAATSTAPAKKDNDTPVGAIAGGVVGGVAALALIGVVGFLFWRRNKKNKAANPPPAVEPSTTQSPPPQNMTQMNTAPGQNVMSPVSPGGTAYPESTAATYTSGGYPPSNYDPRMSYAQGQYPPQPGYGYQSPNPYPPQQGFDQQQQGYNAGGYAPTSTASPPPHLSPSPGFKEGEQAPPAQAQNQPPPMELPANNPVGHENNRAELG